MRGSPIFRLLMAGLAMGLALIPLIHLTGSRISNRAASPVSRVDREPEPTPENVKLEITRAGAPVSLEITYLGNVVWKGRIEDTATASLEMVFPEEGIELGVLGESEGRSGPGAVRIAVTPAGQNPIERTIWTDGAIDEVVVFER